MAALDTTRPAFGPAPVAGHPTNWFSAMVANLVAWNDARLTRHSLSKLTDRELDDIGLTRADIDAVAYLR